MARLRRALAIVAAASILFGCTDGGSGADEPATASVTTTTPPRPRTGGIDVPELPGTYPVALPSIGFGIAVPQGWQATVLTDDALERLAEARLAEPSFLPAAHAVASTGAVFYAAGSDDRDRVADLKVDVQDGVDTSTAALRDRADAVAASDAIADAVVVEDLDGRRIRVDYRFRATPAGDADGEVVEAFGSQLFVADGDRLWSFIVTSEDRATQDALRSIFEASIAF